MAKDDKKPDTVRIRGDIAPATAGFDACRSCANLAAEHLAKDTPR
jgi:hypothetical protein